MAESLFDILNKEAQRKNLDMRSRSARNWFQAQAKKMLDVQSSTLLKDPGLKQVQRVIPGHMHMFVYDPKTKEKLPYYDKFPLTIFVDVAPGGFYGLNLHYLAPGIRAKFLDALLETVEGDILAGEGKFSNLAYQKLKNVNRMKYFKPCFKHYLTSHIQSRIVKVESKDWTTAIFLPSEDFSKRRKTYVWGQSRGMY